jgi:hypothetical protein
MNRTELTSLITTSDDFYKGLDFDQLSDDDLFVIWKSIEAHMNQLAGLASQRVLEFTKLSDKTIFIR